jgi:hypothetical protein
MPWAGQATREIQVLTGWSTGPYFPGQATSARLVLYREDRAARVGHHRGEAGVPCDEVAIHSWAPESGSLHHWIAGGAGWHAAGEVRVLISTTGQMGIALVIVVLLLFVVGPVVVVNRDLLFNRSGIKRRQYSEPPLPFLIIPTSPGAPAIDPVGSLPRRTSAPRTSARQPVEETEESVDSVESGDEIADQPFERAFELSPEPYDDYQEFDEEPFTQVSVEPTRVEPIRVAPLADMRGGIQEADEMDEPSPDATVVFHRPMDEAVQILPGRLHVLSGEAAGKDFRLVSRIGEPPHIVVGRETGPPYRHITLEAPTVSRRHARMDFVDGHWTITNLSKTNPVLVNNRALLNGGTARKLANGDCIELGEVALRFLAS